MIEWDSEENINPFTNLKLEYAAINTPKGDWDLNQGLVTSNDRCINQGSLPLLINVFILSK